MASTDYKYVPAVEHMKRLNDELAIVVHVETREGLQNIEEIVSYPGVDICYVGTFDLAIELGTPGDMNSPAVLQGLETHLCGMPAPRRSRGRERFRSGNHPAPSREGHPLL
jgi:2-keto-3-deoxy-L-rhamnonate aldolase RhmA